MPLFVHILIASAYTMVGLGVALLLPAYLPGLARDSLVTAGGVLWVGCAISHEVLVRLRQNMRFANQMAGQKVAYRKLMNELSGARAQVRLIHEALEAAAKKRNRAAAREIKEVVDEVHVLKRLVEQWSATRAADGRARPGLESAKSGASTPAVEAALGQAEILDIVREGLRSDRVDLYLQPIVSLPQRRRRYLKCFSRIRTPEGTMVVPDQYLDLAEKAGLISTIDNMLLFRCVQLVRRAPQRRFDLGFFYNISPHTLADTEFFREFIDFMIQNEELAPNLIFEFAQEDVARQDDGMKAELARLAGYEFRYSLDRVTSLDVDIDDLVTRRFAFVKIEGARLLTQLDAMAGEVDVRDIKDRFARNGLDLIVEKVETEQMLVELLDFDVDYGQGYLFGAPRLSREP